MAPTTEYRFQVAESFAILGNQGNGVALGRFFSETGTFVPAGGETPLAGPVAIGEYLQSCLGSGGGETVAEAALLDGEPVCLIWENRESPRRVAADLFTGWDDDGLLTEVRVETNPEILERIELIRPGGSFNPLTFDAKHCIREVESAYSVEGGLTILYGNLAPEGAVVKTAGVAPGMMVHEGPAVVYESQEEACDGILGKIPGKEVKAGDVVVIRYEGPRGGPGMQEMLAPTSYIKGVGLGDCVALITDGRFSGGTAGSCTGHISPEAAEGGPIGLLMDGDIISIDIPGKRLEVKLSEEQLSERRKNWSPPEARMNFGWLARYQKMVTNAASGAVLKME